MSEVPTFSQAPDSQIKAEAEALRSQVNEHSMQITHESNSLRAALEEARNSGASQRELMAAHAQKVQALKQEREALEVQLEPLNNRIEFNDRRRELENLVQQYNQQLNQFNADQTPDNLDALAEVGRQILEIDGRLISALQHNPRLGLPSATPYEVLKEHVEEQLTTLSAHRNRLVDKFKRVFTGQ